MSKIKCDHCSLSYEPEVMIKDEDFKQTKYFCCKGCQGIFHLLHEEGLESFYQKKGKTNLHAPKEQKEEFERFDLEGMQKKFVRKQNGLSQISLLFSDIHCAACVWLNEKVLFRAEGIAEVSINATTHKARILYDENIIKLSQILKIIQSIGYHAIPYDPALQESRANAKRSEYYTKLLVALFCSMNIMWIAISQYAGLFSSIRIDEKNILNFAEFILASPVLFYTGSVYFKGAFYGLKNRFVNMDLLVITGASLAYIYSLWAMFSQKGEVYFDSVCMIISFVFVGKYLEVLAQKKAVDTMDFLTTELLGEVLKVHDFGLDKQTTSLELAQNIQIGDIIEIKAGEKILLDGRIIKGKASFDFSSLSGESIPILKGENEEILSGSICVDGTIYYKVSKSHGDSFLSKIAALLEESMSKKPHIQELANRISSYFSLVILSLALCTFIFWYFTHESFEMALIIAISVVVIACPCALSLATPVATLVGLGVGAKHGVLFKSAKFLESIAKAKILVLDKTGTLTYANPKVVDFTQYADFDINLLYSLVANSTHPVSKGVKEFLQEKYQNLQMINFDEVRLIAGFGIEARLGENLYQGGNEALNNSNIKANFIFSINGKEKASFILEDRPKEMAEFYIDKIHKLGLKTVMLTGDNENSAEKIAQKLKINEYHHRLLPSDKADMIDKFHAQNHITIMAGDGINDAIALGKSDIAIAIGEGTDLALNVSDVVLLKSDIKSLYFAIALGKKVYKTIKQNLIFSLAYNALTVGFAMAGFINPLLAAASMSLSSIIVVLNSIKLKAFHE